MDDNSPHPLARKTLTLSQRERVLPSGALRNTFSPWEKVRMFRATDEGCEFPRMLKRFLFFGSFLTFYFLLFTFDLALADPVRLDLVEMKRDRGYDYLDIYTTGWTEAKGLMLEDKLYIDLPGAVMGRDFKVIRRKSKRVLSVAAGRKDPRTVRLTVRLKRPVDYDVVNVFGRNKSVVEIGDRLNGGDARQFAWEKKFVRATAAPLKPVKLPPAARPGDISLKHRTIMLDPGHGGDDPGAAGCGRVPEKELTLLTARECARQLRAAGATVYLSRDEDRRSNLRDVVDFANRARADIFICIHYNSSDDRRVAGSETYYYKLTSRALAETMHEAIVRSVRERDRGLHRAGFYTVKYAEMPSVLIEPAYLSNNDEYELANSPAFRQKLAAGIVKGVKEYFRSQPR